VLVGKAGRCLDAFRLDAAAAWQELALKAFMDLRHRPSAGSSVTKNLDALGPPVFESDEMILGAGEADKRRHCRPERPAEKNRNSAANAGKARAHGGDEKDNRGPTVEWAS